MIQLKFPQEKVIPEQQIQLNKLAKKFLVKSLLSGTNYILMAILMDAILLMGVTVYLDCSSAAVIVGSFCIGFFTMRKMNSAFKNHIVTLHEEAKKIISK